MGLFEKLLCKNNKRPVNPERLLSLKKYLVLGCYKVGHQASIWTDLV
ncbi:hypothetical protein SBF1_5120001 [Candidatus Desulfosporosinus infrequens]|uniref:Uncharacterized protein n=1 Tax=Candidatus Desulfosporosinus infrequens TaxID=2043169 RepID=A0A2U3LI84_9FIRM|nr:hypothetical protein SBF1_5120001 [Candidatus Desulfosporosinus infrequens]